MCSAAKRATLSSADKEVSCRVLTVDAAKKKVVVTHKKTLVTSKLPW